LEAKKGHVLDWCGGWGRISLHLAKKGFKITILDFVEEYLARAKRIFHDNRLPLITIQADCRNTPQHIKADYALCTFNSIGFLSDGDQIKAFKSLHGALKKNGKVIIDCINQLFLSKHFIEVTESKRPDGIRCIKKNHFDLLTSVLHSDFQLINDKGDIVSTRQFSQRIYTPLELRKILERAGFKVLTMFGNFEGDDVSFDLPQMVTVARK
jgi:ubiquinone/menaquinone biosynthesis C-methylase UbiE